MKQISVLRRIYRERGYLVLWQGSIHEKFHIDRVVDCCGGEGFNLGPMRVISQTSKRDFLQQQWRSRRIEPAYWKHTSITKYMRDASKLYGPLIFWRVRRTKRKPA